MKKMHPKRLIAAVFLITFTFLSNPMLPKSTLVSPINNSNVDFGDIDYFNIINNAFELTYSEKQLLKQNRFVVLNRMGTEDILDSYKFFWEEDLPIFITTDAMLHTWHLIFDHTLEDVEEKIFYPLLSILIDGIVSNAIQKYTEGSLQLKTLIYFIVANEFTNSSNDYDLPSAITVASTKIANAIMNEISITSAMGQFNTNLTRRFIDDFTQYKPRGHYTHSESLKNYFRLFKWLSRIPFFFDCYAGQIFLKTSYQQMIQSTLEIVWLLKSTAITFLEQYVTGLEIWSIFKSFLDVIVGQTNSITPIHIDEICKELMGNSWAIEDIDTNLITQVHTAVLSDSNIPEPKSPYIIDVHAFGLFSPKTFVLFGERLTLDSYALNYLVFPYVNRLLPTSLDFAATCLESNQSLLHLQEEFNKHPGLSEQIVLVKEKLNNISGVEKQTIHWQWVEALKDISGKEPGCNKTPIIPEFMNSSAWLDEKLTTICGSWAQLKHDLILYSQQSVTGITCSTPFGYVEPYPEFYSQLGGLSQMYQFSLLPLETIGLNFSNFEYRSVWALDYFYKAVQMLEEIAFKEITGKELNDGEKKFIIETYSERGGICGGPFLAGWLSRIIAILDPTYATTSKFPNSRASLVADIHTDPNTSSVLHLATGLLEPIIAIVPGWENNMVAVVGPVFSFYEFALSGYQRLNDDEWRGILALWLDENTRGNYDFDIFPRGFWAESYMVSTEITLNRIFPEYKEFTAPNWFSGDKYTILEVINESLFWPIMVIFIIPISTCMISLITMLKKKKVSMNRKLQIIPCI